MNDKNRTPPLKRKVGLIGIVIISLAVTFSCISAKRMYEGPQRSVDDVCFVFPKYDAYSLGGGAIIVKIDDKKAYMSGYDMAELLPGNHILEVILDIQRMTYSSRERIWSKTPIPIFLNCEPGYIYMINFKLEGNRWEPFIEDMSWDSRIRDKIPSWRK